MGDGKLRDQHGSLRIKNNFILLLWYNLRGRESIRNSGPKGPRILSNNGPIAGNRFMPH